MDRDEILRVLRAFDAVGLDYVLIGATAMGVHGLIRATEDIDLFVKPNPGNIERLRTALTAAYDGDPNILAISTDDLPGRLSRGSVLSAVGGPVILTRLGEMVTFDGIERERKEVAGTAVCVATPAALYRLTARPSGLPARRLLRFRSIGEAEAARSRHRLPTERPDQ